MTQSHRLILNTTVIFARMAVTVGMGLLVTRILLNGLGELNYGLLLTVGAGITLLTVLNDAVALSGSRHLAVALGRGDMHGVTEIFNTLAALFVVLAIGVGSIGLAIQPLVLSGLTIPPDRASAAAWVYNLALLQLVVHLANAPFLAVYNARQAMIFAAGVEVLSSIFALLAACSILLLPGDGLVIYMQVGTTLVIVATLTSASIAWRLFPEARLHPRLISRQHVRELVSFAGWGILSVAAWKLRMSGSQILLNVLYGPVMNANYGVALQTVNYQKRLAFTVGRTTQPALSMLHGSGGRDSVHSLSLTSSKVSVIIVGLFTLPLMIEAPLALKLWLGDPPALAATLTPLVLLWLFIDQYTEGQRLLASATGDIGSLTRWTVPFSLAPLPVFAAGWWLFDWGATALPITGIVTAMLVALVRAQHMHRCAGLSIRAWADQVVLRPTTVLALGAAMALVPRLTMSPTAWRLGAVTVTFLLICAVLAWLLVLRNSERQHFLTFATSVKRQLRGLWNRRRPHDEADVASPGTVQRRA